MKTYIYTGLALLFIGISSCNPYKIISKSIPKKELPSLYLTNDANKISQIKRADFIDDTLLLQLVDSAFTYNNDVQMAYQKVEMAKSGLQYYKGSLLPQASLIGSGGLRKFGLYTMDGAGNSTTDITPSNRVPIDLPDINIGVQTSWEIDFRGKLTNQKKAAASKLLASEEGVKYIQTNLVADIAYSYYELLALDHELDIINETTQKQNEALEYVKAQKEAGKTNELAVLQFSAQLFNLHILEREVRQLISKEENKLNFLVGRFPQNIHRSKKSLYSNLSTLNAGIPSELLTNRPDIKMASLNVASAKLDLNAAKAAFLPSFNIISGIGFQAFNSNYLFRTPQSIAYNILGGLVAPLVNKSAIKSSFNFAQAIQVDAYAQYQQKILNGYIEVVNELSELDNLKIINLLATKKNKDNITAVENAFSLYKSARVPYLDVIIAQQNALQSNLDLISIAKRIKISNIKLYKSLGGGWF